MTRSRKDMKVKKKAMVNCGSMKRKLDSIHRTIVLSSSMLAGKVNPAPMWRPGAGFNFLAVGQHNLLTLRARWIKLGDGKES